MNHIAVRTMTLDDLRAWLAHTPTACQAECAAPIVADIVFDWEIKEAGELALRHLASSYGLNPDLKDSVRWDVPHFMAAQQLLHNKKTKLNVTGHTGRDKEVESAPWFKVSESERIDARHLTLLQKKAAPEESHG